MDPQTFIDELLALTHTLAPRVKDVPPAFQLELSKLAQVIENYSIEQCEQVLPGLEDIISHMAMKWKGQRVSNYMIFPLRKLKKRITKRVQQLQRPMETKRLDRQQILNDLIASFKGSQREFPDSVRSFVDIARTSVFFSLPGSSEFEWPPSVPILFLLNASSLDHRRCQEIRINSGHCLVGMEPGENPLLAAQRALECGMIAQDVFLYQHIKAFSEYLTGHSVPNSVMVNLDTLYYRDKLVARSHGFLDPVAAMEIVTRIASNHLHTINAILPTSQIFQSHEESRLKQLNEVLGSGLLEFVASLYPGNDSSLVEGIAKVAASYIYLPLMHDAYTLFVESALDVQISARIVIPYLQKRGKLQNFCFIALLPLPDLKASHGAMYFGHSERGKLYINYPNELIEKCIAGMSTNWPRPHHCFYTQYFLARINTIPALSCHPAQCRDHIRMILEDLYSVRQECL